MSAVVFLLVCFLSCSVSEERQITVEPGRDVTLPCRAPNNPNLLVVEWSRSDLERYVYFQRDGYLNTAYQDPSYVNRVQLKDDEMKNGELSLILNNVTNNDEGTYECRYKEERATQITLISIVYLNVTGHTDGDSESGKHSGGEKVKHQHPGVILSVSLIAGLGAAGLVGFMIYKKRKGRSEKKPDLPVDDPDVLQQLQENENSL